MKREDVDCVTNACDAGREGELIFRLVYEKAGCKKPMKRLWISSMEDETIKKGFENLRDGKEYDALYKAALCREREAAIRSFVPESFYTVILNCDGVILSGERMDSEERPHMLRHYFAQSRLDAGWKLPMIANALGHKDTRTTELYLRIPENERLVASKEYFEMYGSLIDEEEISL